MDPNFEQAVKQLEKDIMNRFGEIIYAHEFINDSKMYNAVLEVGGFIFSCPHGRLSAPFSLCPLCALQIGWKYVVKEK